MFVWYRCPLAERTGVQSLALRLLGEVSSECGVHGRLLQRLDADCTWMEHYVLAAGAADLPGLRACMHRHWPAHAPTRHEECFE